MALTNTSAHNSAASAVVLLSGGLDSATVLAMARREGFACHALSVDYGQRHRHELNAALLVAQSLGAASHVVFPLNLRTFGGSALTASIDVPKQVHAPHAEAGGIPVTYVPARNMLFLALAAAHAEVIEARHIFIGANAVDYSGYPDCRPEFLSSMERTINLATKAGVQAHQSQRRAFTIHAPIVSMTKAQIIRAGTELGIDYSITHSCYDPIERDSAVLACGVCDSCAIRHAGFQHAGLPDPTRYA